MNNPIITILTTDSDKVPTNYQQYIQTPFIITDIEHGNYNQTKSGLRIHLQYARPWLNPTVKHFLEQRKILIADDTVFIGQQNINIHFPDETIPQLITLLHRSTKELFGISTNINPIYFHLTPETVEFGKTATTSRTDPKTLSEVPQLQNFNYNWTEQYLCVNLFEFHSEQNQIKLKFVITSEIRQEDTLTQEFRDLFQLYYPNETPTPQRIKEVFELTDIGDGWVRLDKDPEIFKLAPLVLIFFRENIGTITQILQNDEITKINLKPRRLV